MVLIRIAMLWSLFYILGLSHFGVSQQGPSAPIIDIGPLLRSVDYTGKEAQTVLLKLQEACRIWGYFNIINHGIDKDLQSRLFHQMELFFSSSKETKYSVKRTPTNSRGFADDELTKQLRDSKELLDIGQEHFGNVSYQAAVDQLLDGFNMWPEAPHLDQFKPVMDEYYAACMKLSDILFRAILSQLPCGGDDLPDSVRKAFDTHSSFLRLNMYPVVVDCALDGAETIPLGISRHTDAGVLTLLLQDGNAALEMYSGSKQDFGDGQWMPVDPVPGAITVNMGDMMQVP